MLLIFDVDGTLVDGEHTDWDCFHAAAESVLSKSLPRNLVDAGDEVTAPALVRKACALAGIDANSCVQQSIRETYLRNLAKAHRQSAAAFLSFPGASFLFSRLRNNGALKIAVVSGDWIEAVRLKTSAAGISLDGLKIATGSDFHRRTDMLRFVMQQHGASTVSTTYVGDGLWDLRAAKELQLRFIGVGHNRTRLRTHGASCIMDDMHADTVLGNLQFGAVPA